MAIETEIITLPDSTTQTVVYNTEPGGVAIDYSQYFERIASSLENIESYHRSIKEMAETVGIHTVDPYRLFETATTYSYYSENPDQIEAFISGLQNVPEDKLQELRTILASITKLP